jgi:hypothetical protein
VNRQIGEATSKIASKVAGKRKRKVNGEIKNIFQFFKRKLKIFNFEKELFVSF